jgi:hypothetical protein
VFSLDQVVPWGRSFDEYVRMFALDDADLQRSIVGCADGPASFNAEATRRGASVVSCDPLYAFDAVRIRARIDETYVQVQEQTRQNAHDFVWDLIPTVEELGRVRMAAMDAFLADFASGLRDRRYLDAALPDLPFEQGAFGLALCSHFLFLYSSHFDEAFHVDAVREMARVADEVRVFPLLTLDGRPSPFVDPVRNAMRRLGWSAEIERVPYEFQRRGNHMLRMTRAN